MVAFAIGSLGVWEKISKMRFSRTPKLPAAKAIEAQRRRVRRGDGRVERVEGENVSQGAPSLRDGAMKSEYSHQ